MEHRTYLHKLEVRNREKRTIGGLAIPFNNAQTLHPKLKEMWSPGSVKYHDKGVFMFWFHKPDQPLASTRTGRLRFEERSDGIHYEAEIPDTTLGNDLLAMIHLGEVDAVSPGFKMERSTWKHEPGFSVRNILEGVVGELSLTHIPAYQTTTVELRNQGGDFEAELKQIEERRAYLAQLRQRDLKRITSHKGN